MTDRCRHRNGWLIAGGTYEWCYQCGAIRRCSETGIAQVTATSPWCRPTGEGGENPWAAWQARGEAYTRRRTHLKETR